MSGALLDRNDALPRHADVAVVGAGHNGLVAATLLARAGLRVVVAESAPVVGGAARTERPFPSVPGLSQSTGAYLLGLMPPELMRKLGLELPVIRRDPHYFLPLGTTDDAGYLLFGSNREAGRDQFFRHLSLTDWDADQALQAELAALRDDLAPAWLREPLPIEETAERYLRPGLRSVFFDLCRGSVVQYLDRFGFRSELLKAMYVVTDGLSGLSAGPDAPGTGHNFLVHNMCRLPGSDGTWMIVRGGMGTVTRLLAETARAEGAAICTGSPVHSITIERGDAVGVVLGDGREIRASAVLGACDPFRLAELAGKENLPPKLQNRLDELRRPGSTLKLNLALRDLPRFRCLPEDTPGPFGATIHLIPHCERPLDALRDMWADVGAGRLPRAPSVEWYIHTTVDPSLRDGDGHHSSAFFVQSVPYQPAGSSWDRELPPYVDHLIAIAERFAPGVSDLIADTFALPPPEIERHFRISYGHIHHVDNTISFTDRMPHATGIDGLYAGGAGCHPAGSVIGAAGHNAAGRILTDLGLRRPG